VSKKTSILEYYTSILDYRREISKAPSLKYFTAQMTTPDYKYSLSKIIMDAHKEGSNVLVAVVADPRSITKRGVGKSVYALRVLIDVYKTTDWNELRKYIVFMPQDFLRILQIITQRDNINEYEILAKEERLPLLVWDDAGFWLNRQRWMNKFVVAVRENLNVIRTAITSIIFTAPTWGELARGVRDHIDILVSVARVAGNASVAKGYKIVQGILDESRRETIFEDYFTIYLPDEIYKPYDELRKSYVKIGLERMQQRLKHILEDEDKGSEEGASIEDAESIEELRDAWGY